MVRVRQIDLPDNVRAKFPQALGTLKQIKVLTNEEYNVLLPNPKRIRERERIHFSKQELERKEIYRKGAAHRKSCPFVVWDRSAPDYTDYWRYYKPFTCLKHLVMRIPPWVCAVCPETGVKSQWQINIGIAPIDTGNIELPTIHIKKPSRVSND